MTAFIDFPSVALMEVITADANTTNWQLLLQAAKIFGLVTVIGATNRDVFRRYFMVARAGHWGAIFQCTVQWLVALTAVFVMMFNDSVALRVVGGGVIAFSSVGNWLFYQLSHSNITVLDMANLWRERTVTRHALSFYRAQALWALLILAAIWALFIVPSAAPYGLGWLNLPMLNWLPLVSIAGIYIVFRVQKGVSFAPLPAQFLIPALMALTAYLIVTSPPVKRRTVEWSPNAEPRTQNIILLMDESIRGDYLSLEKGNTLTPRLAALAEKFVNFGPAVSGSNSSANTNAIVRFGATLDNISETITTNPSMFSFAKKAGYRTVFINAQNEFVRDGSVFMNFMTFDEKNAIDAFYVTKTQFESDFELADIIAKELSLGGPVFIYANKMGAHFPYEWCYPVESPSDKRSAKLLWGRISSGCIKSYRKAIAWNVDKFMAYLFENADMGNATMIYTSDHGQLLRAGEFPHGQIYDPDPRTGLVPLLAYSTDPALRAAFEKGAAKSRGKASHFQIAPTLYHLMGYDPQDIMKDYPETLFTGTEKKPLMTSGAIFPLFENSYVLTEIDPSLNYFETDTDAMIT